MQMILSSIDSPNNDYPQNATNDQNNFQCLYCPGNNRKLHNCLPCIAAGTNLKIAKTSVSLETEQRGVFYFGTYSL